MITSITFNDVAHSRISYCKKKYLYKKKGVPIKFYPGINVLVGNNEMNTSVISSSWFFTIQYFFLVLLNVPMFIL